VGLEDYRKRFMTQLSIIILIVLIKKYGLHFAKKKKFLLSELRVEILAMIENQKEI
jgi:hypothetical protein